MQNKSKNIRYQLVTPTSLLANRVMETIAAHKNGIAAIYDEYPVYALSMALNDNNTVMLSAISAEGQHGIEEE
jgi:hypothetical protein